MEKYRKIKKSGAGPALLVVVSLGCAFMLTACQAREEFIGPTSNTAGTSTPVSTSTSPASKVNGSPAGSTSTSVAANPTSGVAASATAGGIIKQPPQPADGPGGKNYPYAGVRSTVVGKDATAVTIFEPQQPAPANAPVVLFLHGYDAFEPRNYLDWIDHIVRRGNIVLYPQYQAEDTAPTDFLPNIFSSTQAALTELTKSGHVQPQLDKFFIVGHSLGGLETANVAAMATENKLPVPLAIMPVEPAHLARTENQGCPASMPNSSPPVRGSRDVFAQIPASTLMVMVTGEVDQVVGIQGACQIWQGTSQIPEANKVYVTLQSDDHGTPKLVGNHFAPGAPPNTSDALDFYGTWKLFDALQSCALTRTGCDVALGGSPDHTFMGNWSDGTPVKPLVSTKTPF